MRATYGAAAKVSGTIIAVVPMALPTIARVIGVIITARIRNGIERRILTTTPRTVLTIGIGRMPPLSVTTSVKPHTR